MKWLNFERLMMILGALSAIIATVTYFEQGYRVYGWPIAVLCWIGVSFLKDLQIKSLTKNK